jgi:hypothetical protein
VALAQPLIERWRVYGDLDNSAVPVETIAKPGWQTPGPTQHMLIMAAAHQQHLATGV